MFSNVSKSALPLAIAMGLFVLIGCNKLLPESPASPSTVALSGDGNPQEWVGEAHNQILDLLDGQSASENPSAAYADVVTFMQDLYNFTASEILAFEEVETELGIAVDGGYAHFTSIAAGGSGGEEAVLSNLESTILNSSSQAAFEDGIGTLVEDVQLRNDLDNDQKDELLGAIAVAKHSTVYWANYMGEPGFGTPGLEKKNWPLWADIGGFIAGFGGSLVYNNNNGGAGDVNPFASGAALGGLASDLAKGDPPKKD